MNFRKNDIIILLGAGASKDSGIPTSANMIEKVEALLEDSIDWKDYKKLYDYIKSKIICSDGIRGKFGNNVNFNIERLVNVLSELEKKEEHIIYSFIATWDKDLIARAGDDFKRLSELKRKIIQTLKEKWITLENYQNASYYCKLIDFKNEYTYSLRIFTLNYDLGLEKNCGYSYIERGFDENRKWDWRRFEENENLPVDIYLYKMHGSIDWKRNEAEILTYSDEIGSISIDELDIIFGDIYKLRYLDPYLIFASEFRKYLLEAKLIIAIGYSFSDEHINGLIKQALDSDSNRKILCVSPARQGIEYKKEEISKKLNIKNVLQIEVKGMSAKFFMKKELNIEALKEMFPTEKDFPFSN